MKKSSNQQHKSNEQHTSSIKVVALKCPNCGANIEVRNGIDNFYCTYCGANITIIGQDKNILKAKIKYREIEKDENIQYMKIANSFNKYNAKLQADDRKDKRSWLGLGYFAIFIVMIFLVMYLLHVMNIKHLENTVSQAREEMSAGNYDEALTLANTIYDDSDWSNESESKWNNIRESLIEQIKAEKEEAGRNSPDVITMPCSYKEYLGENYQDITVELKNLGFTSIKSISLNKKSGLFHSKGDIASLSIDGTSEFRENDYFSRNADIILYYYGN